jgi:putative flippase GtrA
MPISAPASTASKSAPPLTLLQKIKHLFPAGQFLRYLAVGIWNTIFGYGMYALFVSLFSHLLPHRYLPLTVDLAQVTSSPISITMSYLCYKFFVFRTEGNYLREWLRCFAVYGSGMIPPLIMLPILTRFLQHLPHLQHSAPYVAGALMTGFTAVYSYLGHKKFSFRAPKSKPAAEPPTM